jgi:peroxiredoxin Q/BCP
MTIMLEVGTKAPQFTLLNQDGKEVSLSDFKGKKVVLYFYSKDNTAGCTKQACGFAEKYPDFLEKGAEVIGVSKDSVDSHRKFADKHNLTFTLLSDPDKKVIEEYDVWKEKTMYGKKTMGVVRTTYLIDEEGIITKAFTKVNAAKNPADMLENM